MEIDKKIPITVLILCLIALIGSGLSLTSTVTSDNNQLTENKLTIDMGTSEYLEHLSEPGTGNVDGLLSGVIERTNTKSGETNTTTSLLNIFTSFKVFGSNATSITVDISDSTADGDFKIVIEGTNAPSSSINLNPDVTTTGSLDFTIVAGEEYILNVDSNNATPGNLKIKLTVTDGVE